MRFPQSLEGNLVSIAERFLDILGKSAICPYHPRNLVAVGSLTRLYDDVTFKEGADDFLYSEWKKKQIS